MPPSLERRNNDCQCAVATGKPSVRAANALPCRNKSPQGETGSPKSSLERREQTPLPVVLVLFAASTFTDVSKMVCSYSLRYHNHGSYPMNQSLMVALTEALKCVLVTVMHVATSGSLRMRPSYKFLLPSVIYMLTNNIFFYALHYVTPAVWLVFVQCRIFLTLFVYKYPFGRHVTRAQWTAGALIAAAVVGSQADVLAGHAHSSSVVTALALALLCGTLSTMVAVYTEYYFKNDSRSIWEQQCQIYFGTAVISSIAPLFSAEALISADDLTGHVLHFLIATIAFSATNGLCVALVVTRLDNVVKYHVSATSSVLNTFASAALFPDQFRITPAYVVSLLVLMVAIYLYEKKSFVLPDFVFRWFDDGTRRDDQTLAPAAGDESGERADDDEKAPLV
nr:CMP-sialic acid transporter 1-like [Rhipicephalus microplus]